MVLSHPIYHRNLSFVNPLYFHLEVLTTLLFTGVVLKWIPNWPLGYSYTMLISGLAAAIYWAVIMARRIQQGGHSRIGTEEQPLAVVQYGVYG